MSRYSYAAHSTSNPPVARHFSSQLAHYKMEPVEHAELRQPVMDLLFKGFICESNSRCPIPTLLTPKKDRSWRMRINKEAIKLLFPTCPTTASNGFII